MLAACRGSPLASTGTPGARRPPGGGAARTPCTASAPLRWLARRRSGERDVGGDAHGSRSGSRSGCGRTALLPARDPWCVGRRRRPDGPPGVGRRSCLSCPTPCWARSCSPGVAAAAHASRLRQGDWVANGVAVHPLSPARAVGHAGHLGGGAFSSRPIRRDASKAHGWGSSCTRFKASS
jgi:hypothetical protein